MTATTITTSKSRKRKRRLDWEVVVDNLPGISIEKNGLVADLEKCTSDATAFLELTQYTQDIICEACGITSWAQKIIETLVSVRLS